MLLLATTVSVPAIGALAAWLDKDKAVADTRLVPFCPDVIRLTIDPASGGAYIIGIGKTVLQGTDARPSKTLVRRGLPL